ncbi:hypothetical protein Pan181_30620 [Aeoliella mucimassa]|uniref:Uncharacterized protein n=1 Tax=Aeoliella mucimassa TaxID=2527972 RepID=A0A518AQ44_9BACT|nr:hypothetical protein Pan181_30620 [Aeoliella mucimassa]
MSLARFRHVKALQPYVHFGFSPEWNDARDAPSSLKLALNMAGLSRLNGLGLIFPVKNVLIDSFREEEHLLNRLSLLKEVSAAGVIDSEISSITLNYLTCLPDLKYLSLAGTSTSSRKSFPIEFREDAFGVFSMEGPIDFDFLPIAVA